MNKIRIIPTILFKKFSTVKGRNFASWRIAGNLNQVIKIYSLREVDEIVFFDVDAHSSNELQYNLVENISEYCFMPLTVGGGIKNLFHIEKLLNAGADKVCINTECFFNKQLIIDAVKKFGSQCISISIDYKLINHEKFVHVKSGNYNTNKKLIDYFSEINELNVGEIICTSIDHEGMMQGFDIETIKLLNNISRSPIIASGGCGKPSDVINLLKKADISAISIASMFHFTEHTPLDVKKELKRNGFNVRE